MSDIRMVKSVRGWIPSTPHDEELTRAWKIGDIVKFTAKKPRNGKHHRLMFALIDMVFDNMPEQYADQFPNKEILLDELKIQAGHCTFRKTLGGRPVVQSKSIAFDSMGQEEFNIFYTNVIEVICKYFLPGVTSEEVKDEILQAAGGR